MNKYLNENKNDSFSNLKGLDLRELLLELDNSSLEYRESLNLDKKITIGLEIEYEHFFNYFIKRFIYHKMEDWIYQFDGSLSYGGEITSPVLKDRKECMLEIKRVCDYLDKKKVNTFGHAGGHIHIGAKILKQDIDNYRTFVKYYTLFESVLFRFGYSDKINGRPTIFKYAVPISDFIIEKLDEINKLEDFEKLIDLISYYRKYQALNFNNVITNYKTSFKRKHTIEFRLFNASSDDVIWQNNINLCGKMIMAIINNQIDYELIDYKLTHNFKTYKEARYLYNYIDLAKVLLFVDMNFNNNLDKAYFLIQYLKDFNEIGNYRNKNAVLSKRFTK